VSEEKSQMYATFKTLLIVGNINTLCSPSKSTLRCITNWIRDSLHLPKGTSPRTVDKGHKQVKNLCHYRNKNTSRFIRGNSIGRQNRLDYNTKECTCSMDRSNALTTSQDLGKSCTSSLVSNIVAIMGLYKVNWWRCRCIIWTRIYP
jgi:hypothetical protein